MNAIDQRRSAPLLRAAFMGTVALGLLAACGDDTEVTQSPTAIEEDTATAPGGTYDTAPGAGTGTGMGTDTGIGTGTAGGSGIGADDTATGTGTGTGMDADTGIGTGTTGGTGTGTTGGTGTGTDGNVTVVPPQSDPDVTITEPPAAGAGGTATDDARPGGTAQ
ncbi:hypothetical protein [Azospirillum halopraeferens]|uniref:hypothetical protein n=1 Tax=Azospirillum halopraeferens TaxID=34010 RepID=UPI0003F996A2|nr:hypothetical protein [Azospirillum halopraeferens]